jgi:hypothetical protein
MASVDPNLLLIAGIGLGLTFLVYSGTPLGNAVGGALTTAGNIAQQGLGRMEKISGYVDQGIAIVEKGVNQVSAAIENSIDVGAGTIPRLEGCPSGYRDDGFTCTKDLSCRTWCDGGRDALGNCWAWDLKTECSGPDIKGKGSTCDDKENVDGLCYRRCPGGYKRVPGMPYLCRKENY